MPLRERTPTERVVTHLRRETKPASIFAELTDGTTQHVDLGVTRGRWERVLRNLSSLDWLNLKCYSEPEGKGVLIDTLPNLEAAEPDAESDGAAPEDPLAQVGRLFDMASKHVERVVKEIRTSDGDYENARTTFIANLTERNTQLEALAGQSLQRLQEAVELIVTMRTETGSNLSEKEQALFGAVDGIGAKLGLWSSGTIKTPQLPVGRGNGAGKVQTESEET